MRQFIRNLQAGFIGFVGMVMVVMALVAHLDGDSTMAVLDMAGACIAFFVATCYSYLSDTE